MVIKVLLHLLLPGSRAKQDLPVAGGDIEARNRPALLPTNPRAYSGDLPNYCGDKVRWKRVPVLQSGGVW